MKSKESVSLSIEDRSLKIAKMHDSGAGRTIVGVYSSPVEDLSAATLSAEITKGLKALHCKLTEVSLIVPSKYAITKNIEVPSLDPKEIESIVRLQAVRHTPYSKEEVIVGHINLEKILDRYTKSLLVIVANDYVKTRTDALDAAGITVAAVRLSSEVVSSALSQVGATKSLGDPCIFVALNDETTDFLITQNSKPYYLRSIPIGYKQILEDTANNTKQLLDEVKKTNEAYQSEEHGVVAKRMILDTAGYKMDVRALSKGLENLISIPVTPFIAEQAFTFSPDARKQLEEAGAVSLLDVMSCAVAESDTNIDLTPEDVRVRKAFRAKGKEAMTAGALVLAIIFILICTIGTQVFFRKMYYSQLTHNFETKQKDADYLIDISEKTRLVKNFKSQRGRAIRVMDEAQGILPRKMYLNEISLAKDGKVTLKGTSELMSTVFSFVTLMENHPYFKTVNSDYTKSRKEGDKDVSDFGISAYIEEKTANGR